MLVSKHKKVKIAISDKAVSHDNRNTLWVNNKNKQLIQKENNPRRGLM